MYRPREAINEIYENEVEYIKLQDFYHLGTG